MPQTPADIPEGVEFRKDGTVVIHLDDDDGRSARVNLRRPKMRELRRFREEEWEIADQIREFDAPLRDALDSFLKDRDIEKATVQALTSLSTEDLRAYQALQRERDQKVTLFAEEQRVPWAQEVIETLSGHRLEEDDLPPWCSGAEFAGHLIGHWLTVPTRRGSP